MRLGTCIALELFVVAAAAGGVSLAVSRGSELARSYVQAHEAAAATPGPAPELTLVPLPRARLAIARPPPDTVFGAPDHDLLLPIAATPLVKVKLNHGGTSLSLRLDFASGARAAFKPLQTHPQSDPRREIAAYRIDRLLGIGHVPPAKSAAFAIDDVIAAVEPAGRAVAAQRIADEALPRRGKLVGEVSWWIPDIKLVHLDGHGIDEPEGQAAWTAYLQAGATIPAELRPVVAQIATVVLFDLLIDNSDRWSGNNTQGSLDSRTLYFMDNTLSFSTYTLGHTANLSKLYRIQVFPRTLVARLRALTVESVEAALGGEDDLLGPLLTRAEIRAIIARRDHFLEYIDRLIAELGEDAVLALP
ncbi:MAG TPA: hypothetical protein VFK02_30275 [Kofleriaceae bacterium]|nr:hypothetical protein [Kofleriaceae bacterium]